MSSYADEHGRIVSDLEPGPLVQTVDFGMFCEDVRLISSQLRKSPVESDLMGRWLERKFKIVSHLPVQRWIEISDIALNSWQFWNEFTPEWVTQACRECDRLEKSRAAPPPPMPDKKPIGAYIGVWLAQCAKARSLGQPEPTMADVREQMRAKGCEPEEGRYSLNQLILSSLSGALATKPVSQGLTREETRAAKREAEELWA